MNIEASVDGKRLIVDSGLFNYEDDEMRWYCRSSLAHNVVSVDDNNQFDIWSKFRMGYRGHTSHLKDGRNSAVNWASACHNAFRRLGVGNVSRLVAAEPGKFWYCVDHANGKGRTHGKSGRSVSGFVHFSPQTSVNEVDNGRFRVVIGENQFDLSIFGASRVKTCTGWYCPEFGQRQANVVIEYVFAENIPAGWLLWFNEKETDEADKIVDPTRSRPCLKAKSVADQIQVTVFAPATDEAIHNFLWNLDEMKIACIVGARPNFMKIAPILRALKNHPTVEPVLIHTGQHYDANLSDVFFEELGISRPDIALGIGSGTHARQTADILVAIEDVLLAAKDKGQPFHRMVVVGDVNSTMAAAIAATKLLIPVAHVEAGLRSLGSNDARGDQPDPYRFHLRHAPGFGAGRR